MKCMSTYLKFNPHCVCWGGCECLCGICVTWLIVHDSFHVTWLIVRDRTHLVWLNWRGITPCVCHGSLCVTWLILCDTTHAVVPDASARVVVFVSALWYTPDIAYFSWLVLHNMTHHTWHDSFCVTWLVLRDMIHAVVPDASVHVVVFANALWYTRDITYFSWVVVLRDMTHFTWHDSLCVTWLILCDMTHAVVPDASVHVVVFVGALWYTRDITYFSWLILRDMTHHTWHDSLCVTWLVLRDMTHAVVPEASVRVVVVVSASDSAHAALNRGRLAVNGNICMYMYMHMCVSARLCVCVCLSVCVRFGSRNADSWASRCEW